jgi:hypothetical protein
VVCQPVPFFSLLCPLLVVRPIHAAELNHFSNLHYALDFDTENLKSTETMGELAGLTHVQPGEAVRAFTTTAGTATGGWAVSFEFAHASTGAWRREK